MTIATPTGAKTGPDIVVVGAGFGGIGVGATLKRAGIDSFLIIDKAPSVGGTWWYNQYPGAEVDTPSCAYSFPFKRHDWSRTHAKQPELLQYLEETVDQFGMRPNIRLEVGLERAVWDEASHEYVLSLDTGETLRCNVLISATGFLNIPRYPSWPGLDEFEGPKFHTARWEHEHDLHGKTVSVVGTGSSSAQLVSELAHLAGHIYVYQREPGWILPKGERDLSDDERAKFRNRMFYDLARLRFFWMAEKSLWRAGVYTPGAPQNETAKQLALGYIEAEFADRPDLKKAVTPTYPIWGKRLVLDSRFYPALKRENVELVPRAVRAVTRSGVVDTDGVERDTDVLIFATGFEPTNYLGTMEIVGLGGQTLRDYWNGEPRAFLGVTVPGFPNMFIIYGPGTNGGEIVSNLLAQGRYATACGQTNATARHDGGRGEERVGGPLSRLAAVENDLDLVGGHQQLLHCGLGQGRHPVAVQRNGVSSAAARRRPPLDSHAAGEP